MSRVVTIYGGPHDGVVVPDQGPLLQVPELMDPPRYVMEDDSLPMPSEMTFRIRTYRRAIDRDGQLHYIDLALKEST